MKHPALTRVFAIVLTVLCLVMLIAGLGILSRSAGDLQRAREDDARLRDRMEEYLIASEALKGTVSYEDARKELDSRQEAHEEEAVQHRIDLATYTATRGGVTAGQEALDQAQAALSEGKAQYEAGLKLFEEQEKAFEEGYQQYLEGKEQLAAGQQELALAEQTLSGLRTQLEGLKNLDELMMDEGEDSRVVTVEAYDNALAGLDSAIGLLESFKEQDGISGEQMKMIVSVLLQQADLDEETKARLQELEKMEFEGITAEQIQQIEDTVAESTGMTLPELRQQIQSQRDELAGQDAEAPLDEEQMARLRESYAQNRELIRQAAEALEQKLDEYEAAVAESRSQMEAAQAQMEQMDAYMEQGKAGIEQGRAAMEEISRQMAAGEGALYEGQLQLWDQLAKLRDQEEELKKEKEELDRQAEELRLLEEEARAQKDMEQRQTSYRLMLLDRDGIRERVDDGMELLSAAREYADQTLADAEQMARGRQSAAILMIIGAVAGVIGDPAAFEKTRHRFWLIGPVLLCLVLAAAAEILCLRIGKGSTYSALGVMIFAALQLLIILPKKKTQ